MPFMYSNTSDSSSPTPSESDFSYESSASASSLSSTPSPKRSTPRPELSTPKSTRLCLKPSLKSSESLSTDSSKKSPSAIVRFAEPAPTPKLNPKWGAKRKTLRKPEPLTKKRPSPLVLPQPHNGLPFASPTASLSKDINGSYLNPAPAPPNFSRPRSLQVSPAISIEAMKRKISYRSMAQESPEEPDPRWAGIPLPAHYTPPSLGPKSRGASYQSSHSFGSRYSTQSTPAVLETPATSTAPSGQYNPLENYIPCMYPSCKSHYTPAHLGPSFFLSSGPYSLTHLQAHCPRHAVRELEEANATLKRAYEVLRQNAGRKTLGTVAAEFEELKEEFHDDRRLRNAKLVRAQKRRVLGCPAQDSKGNTSKQEGWDWRYTRRPCISSSCKAKYNPYSNHLYSFYRTPHPGTSFYPQQTFCPSCAKQDIDDFVLCVKQKRGSRCGWDRHEWLEWLSNKVKDRAMEQDYWVKAQERVVREKGPARWVSGLEDDVRVEIERQEQKKFEKTMRRSLFKRWVASMSV